MRLVVCVISMLVFRASAISEYKRSARPLERFERDLEMYTTTFGPVMP